MDERLLTTKEVAERLKVHLQTVREWVRKGDLPAIKFGPRTGHRIRESDFERFLTAKMGKPEERAG